MYFFLTKYKEIWKKQKKSQNFKQLFEFYESE